MTSLLLLLFGLLLIYLEFYLPGAILGTIGGILVFSSIVLFASETSSIFLIVLFALFAGASCALLIKYALWRIPRVPPERSIYSDSSQTGYVASSFDQEAIGKEGSAACDLRPGGYITVDGKTLPAISESGYVNRGEKVVVLRGEGDSLIVRKKSE